MKVPFSLFLALRYLKPKRTFISIITLVSIFGVTLGVTVLILVISVMTGFDRELRQKVIDFDAHILVTTDGIMTNWRDLTVKLRHTPGVVATAPYIQGPVIVEFHNRRLAPMIRGIDPAQEEKVIPLRKFIKLGKLDLEGDSTVLGVDLAQKLGVTVGDKLTVYSPGNLGEILDKLKELDQKKGAEKDKAIDDLREVVLPKELTVTGIFETGQYLHDSEFLLVPIFIGQELYGLGDALHGITVKTVNPYDVDRIKASIEKYLPPTDYAETWIEMNKQFFDAVRLERTVMAFLLFFIVIVAAFGICNTLITVTVQKRREIGIMKAVGANLWQIMGVFLFPGNRRWRLRHCHGTRAWHDADPFPERVQSMARPHSAHRDFPALRLPVLADPGRGDSQRCGKNLHRGIYHLFVSRAHSGLLRRAGRSGESAALRIGEAYELHPRQMAAARLCHLLVRRNRLRWPMADLYELPLPAQRGE